MAAVANMSLLTPPGAMAFDCNALRAPIGRKGPHETFNSGFRSGIQRVVLDAHDASRDTGHHDDTAMIRISRQVLVRRCGDEELCLGVDRKDMIEFLGR